MDVEETVVENMELTPIQTFYHDTKILITGGTGFVGRLLVEKLLRSCPTISTIYLIVRNKKGKNLTTRLDELFDDTVFKVLKSQCPKFKHKVVGIDGDCAQPQLGLSEIDRQMLIENVHIVFHVAAIVKFDEKLSIATSINVKGTTSMLELISEMKKLKSFIHVSTAYSYCTQPIIEEKLYPLHINGDEFLKIVNNVPDKLLCEMTEYLLDEYPNTYTFTKAMAEYFVSKKSNEVPVGIFRPSIISLTYKEPMSAWINNVYGIAGIMAAAAAGILRTLHCDSSYIANIVPGDMCVNAMIAMAWKVGTSFEKRNESTSQAEIQIYHFESSNDRPITWERFRDLVVITGINFPTIKAVWYYTTDFYKYKVVYSISKYLLHIIPAMIVDTVLWCIGKQPMLLRLYEKIHKMVDVLAYFVTREIRFQSNRMRQLESSMSERDRKIFFSNLLKLDWDVYCSQYMIGIRQYLFQEDMKTLDDARVRWRRLYYLHITVKLIGTLLMVRLLWALFSFLYGVFLV